MSVVAVVENYLSIWYFLKNNGGNMLSALLDNSTLTAVQRLLGEIEILNKNVLDMDILAFEQFIQSLLFYDHHIVVDDYKKKHQHRRRKYFDYINFIDPEDVNYDKIISKSAELSKGFIVDVEKGTISNKDIGRYLKLMRMGVHFSWDINASVYFLTQKCLLKEGVSHSRDLILSAGISSQRLEIALSSQEIKDEVYRVFHKGEEVIDSVHGEKRKINKREIHIPRSVSAFLASLNWIANRSTYYTLMSNYICSDMILHPVRHKFSVEYLPNIIPDIPGESFRLISRFTSDSKRVLKELCDIVDPCVNYVDLPFFSVWAISKTGDMKKVISEIMETREKKEFVESRTKLRELDQLSSDKRSRMIEINKLRKSLNMCLHKIMAKYGLETPQGVSLSPFVRIGSSVLGIPGIADLPGVDYKIPKLSFLRNIIRDRGFSAVYKNVLNDLMSIERLGQYYEKLTSSALFKKDARNFDMKVEEPKYVRAKPWWKLPME